MKRRDSLLQRVILLFSVLVAGSSIVFFLVLFLFFSSGNKRIQEMSRQREVMAWTAFLSGYYMRYGNWEDLEQALSHQPPFPPPSKRPPGEHGSMMMSGHMARYRIPIPSVYDTAGILQAGPEVQSRESLNDSGYTITVNGEVVGIFYLPPVRRFQMKEGEKRLLGYLSLFLLAFALFSPILFLLLGSRYLKRLFRPIDKVTRAAERASIGDFSVRIPEQGTGEVFTLIQQFNRMAHSIERSESWKRRLISDTAHELRTPVMLLQGRLEMIKEGVYPLDHSQAETLYSDVTRLSALISQLQELSSLEGDQSSQPKEPVECGTLIQEVIDSFGSVLDEKDIVLENNIRRKDLFIQGRSVQIRQLFSNVIANAVEFSPGGSSIVLSIEEPGEYFRFAVEDNGPGIPVEKREDVFQRYYRLDESRNRTLGGTGLGLAICRAIAESHGGTIFVGDKKSRGTRIVIDLPPMT